MQGSTVHPTLGHCSSPSPPLNARNTSTLSFDIFKKVNKRKGGGMKGGKTEGKEKGRERN
jgi:hypothetical protein